MRIIAGVLLCVGAALSGYVNVDQSVFQSCGAGRKSVSSSGSQFRAVNHVKVNGAEKVKFIQVQRCYKSAILRPISNRQFHI